MTIDQYCREIESYLCRKNDGHLIRIVGPSFELVSGWADAGVPIKIAFSGIDRAFARYHGTRPRRRPLKIDFCDADVQDAFDAWRRAVGLAPDRASGDHSPGDGQSRSLPAHLQRVILRLSSARASGLLDETFDPILDAAAHELETARAAPQGIRGAARQALIARLDALDAELLRHARGTLDESTRREIANEAEAELAGFRDRVEPDRFASMRDAAVDRLLRERLQLPSLGFR